MINCRDRRRDYRSSADVIPKPDMELQKRNTQLCSKKTIDAIFNTCPFLNVMLDLQKVVVDAF